MSYSSKYTISTIAKREMKQSFRSKGIILTIAILFLAIIGVTGFSSYKLTFAQTDSNEAIATVNLDDQLLHDSGYTLVKTDTRAEAEQLITTGEVSGALVLERQTITMLHPSTPRPEHVTLATQLADRLAITHGLEQHQLDVSQFFSHLPVYTVDTEMVSSAKHGHTAGQQWNLHAALVGLFLLMLSITLFASTIGARVTEEKSSRIIEIIVSAVKPADVLAGKIIGNVVFGTCATGLLFLSGLVSLHFTGLLQANEISLSIALALLAAYFIGLLFFSALYAAAGSMVQRSEDLQSTQMPIMLLIFAVLYSPIIFFPQVDTTWMQALAWIPPLSIGYAPLQFAAGNLGGIEFSIVMVATLCTTAIVIRISAYIYVNAILHNDSKLHWRDFIRRS